MEYILQTQKLCKKYGKFKALNDLTINVPKGSIYGMVGRNGAGKTTLIRVITGLNNPTSGEFSLFSVKNNDAVNKIIDYVPDVVNRFTGGKNAFVDRDIDKAVEKASEEMDGASESE